jgi:predicted metal-dependent hydrolase
MNSAGNRLSSSQTALETLAAELENSSRQNQLLISQILQLVTEEHGHAEENARQIETLRQQIQQSRNSQGGQG